MVEKLARELSLPPLVARVLLSRGIKTVEEAEKFLYPDLRDLSDPYLLPDMEKAVLRVIEAISRNEDLCIYGDYDTDGITSCALVLNFFKSIGKPVDYYIPTREKGYGINESSLYEISKKGIKLIIALDLGTTSSEQITLAKKLGIDTIVLDHHEPKGDYPPASAFVNPKRSDSLFPTRELAACGVTFFFLIALRRELKKRGFYCAHINLKKELDLVTLGTIADLVPLSGDNRIVTKFGLEMMKKSPRQWLRSFYEAKLLPQNKIDDHFLSFVVIPRLNAPGRVSDAKKALQFLVEEDPHVSLLLLNELNEANKKRQAIEESILQEISLHLSNEDVEKKKGFVLFNERWHLGVIGIVAQRIVETYGKPAVVLTSVDGIVRGSARATEDINLYKSIGQLSHLLLKYGGHRYACGLTLLPQNLELFCNAFESSLSFETPSYRAARYDTQGDFDELNREVVQALDLLAPFGTGNPPPRILLFPESVFESGGKLKILDKRRRVWYGFPQKTCIPIPEKIGGVIVTPILKEEMGEEFVNLLVREILCEP